MLLEFSTCTLIVDLHSVLLQTFACHYTQIVDANVGHLIYANLFRYPIG